MAVPMEGSAKKVAFGGFTPHVAWLRFAWQAWQGTWFCVAGAIQLSWQASTLDVSIFIFAALRSCRVACFLRIALSRLPQVVTRCKFRDKRGIL